MSATRAALRDLTALRDVLAGRAALADISLCRRQADARPRHDGPPPLPPSDVVEALRRELQLACASSAGAPGIPLGTLRKAPLVLWNGDPQAAGFPGLLDAFLGQAAGRARWQRDLIEAWLRDFADDRLFLREIGDAIARLLADASHPRLVAWRDVHATFRVFDVVQGPANVGQILLRGTADVATTLRILGMDDPLRANGGFFRAAVAEMVKALPRMLRAPTARQSWRRAVEVLEVTRLQPDRTGREISQTGLRFHDLAGPTADACLEPWLRGEPPADAPKEEIKAFLLRVIGDPRMQPARWSAVSDGATKLMRSWLAADLLEAFLSLISQTNDDPQWRYRQAFWRGCLRKIPSAEVWVVLGRRLASRAKTRRDLAGGFGQMDASGADGDQAVLLMRLGNLVLSEWSNVGPVRAWDSNGGNCPALYQSRYQVDRLKAPSLDFPEHPERQRGGSASGNGLRHFSPASGLWQGCAAALLFNRLQIKLEPKDYMP